MGVLADIIDLVNSEYGILIGLVFTSCFIGYQLFWPSWLHPRKPKIRKMIDDGFDSVHENITGTRKELKDDIQRVEDRVDDVDKKQVSHIQVTRSLASVNNPRDELNQRNIDEYLVRNGVTKDHFLDKSADNTEAENDIDDDNE